MKNKQSVASVNVTDILHYLYVNRIASTGQIKRDLFVGLPLNNCQRSLQRARSKGLISAYRDVDKFDRQYRYGLTAKGFRTISDCIDYLTESTRYQSDSHVHDSHLLDIKSKLLGRPSVVKYYTETEIQNQPIFSHNDLRFVRDFRFDACVVCEAHGGKRRYIPIQYERSQKSNSEYNALISRYYSEENLSHLVYICEKDRISKAVMREGARFASEAGDKIYFASLKNVIDSREALTFRGLTDQWIRL